MIDIHVTTMLGAYGPTSRVVEKAWAAHVAAQDERITRLERELAEERDEPKLRVIRREAPPVVIEDDETDTTADAITDLSIRLATEALRRVDERLRDVITERGWTIEQAIAAGLCVQIDNRNRRRVVIGEEPVSGWFGVTFENNVASVVEER